VNALAASNPIIVQTNGLVGTVLGLGGGALLDTIEERSDSIIPCPEQVRTLEAESEL
jgi:hypothetical protein